MANQQSAADKERIEARQGVAGSFMFLGFLCFITFMGGSGEMGGGNNPGDGAKVCRFIIVILMTIGLVGTFIFQFGTWAKCDKDADQSPEGSDIVPVLMSALAAAYGLVNCLAPRKVWFAVDIVVIVLFLPVVLYFLYQCIRLEISPPSRPQRYQQLPSDVP